MAILIQRTKTTPFNRNSFEFRDFSKKLFKIGYVQTCIPLDTLFYT